MSDQQPSTLPIYSGNEPFAPRADGWPHPSNRAEARKFAAMRRQGKSPPPLVRPHLCM